MGRFYLTTAIDYVNSRPHLGTAYEKIAADVIARYKRLAGFDTHFVMGNDEHSQNVYRKARELGEDPLAYCDRMAQEFLDVWQRMNISFDDFIRTSEPRHRAGVQELVRHMTAAGDIYEGHYEGWYCVSCEAFKQEKDVVDGLCPIHRTRPDWIREKNFFFRLSRYGAPLLTHFADHPEFLVPDVRRNEILRLLETGLDDISVSRAGQAWGIPMPQDPSSVIYVWVDALINYITAVGFGTDESLTARWWPADLHVIGKDITRFHAVIWPAMLISAGLPLPRQIFGHGWVHYRGEKMSKSLGTTVEPLDALERFGADPLRLYLVKEISFGSDGDFTWERYEDRYNVDLANNLGNLVSRVAAMAEKYRGGHLRPSAAGPGRLAALAGDALCVYEREMEAFALEGGVAAAFRIVDAANEFIAETEPWALARDPAKSERLSQVLFDVAEAVRVSAILLLPVIPASAPELLRRMGERTAPGDLRLGDAGWRNAGERTIQNGDALWPRFAGAASASVNVGSQDPSDKASKKRSVNVTADQFNNAGPAAAHDAPPSGSAPAPAPEPSAASIASQIGIDDFMKVDLRVARVLTAEKVPNSRKLVKLSVDLGTEQRTLVAGIAEAYEAEALVGRTIVMVFNLKPAKLMGIESNGMVLAASPDGGKPALVGFDQEVPPGTRVR
ncbi:MAG: methionine--tRNA ligase [Acidobacteria bacterium]|nr:methionine--tRNA ligase [Acidobacteriota bacterium]